MRLKSEKHTSKDQKIVETDIKKEEENTGKIVSITSEVEKLTIKTSKVFHVKIVRKEASNPKSALVDKMDNNHIILLSTFSGNQVVGEFRCVEGSEESVLRNQCEENYWFKTLMELDYEVKFYVHDKLKQTYNIENSRLRSHMQFWIALAAEVAEMKKKKLCLALYRGNWHVGLFDIKQEPFLNDLFHSISDRDKLVLC